jgi:hypothetical protein
LLTVPLEIGNDNRIHPLAALKQSFGHQFFAELNAKLFIDVQQGDGDAADRRSADQVGLASGNVWAICGGED